MKLVLTVCDVCGDKDREVRTYTVRADGRAATTERCAEHGAVFEEVLAQNSTPRPTRTRRERHNRTMTMEEIEALKARKGAGPS